MLINVYTIVFQLINIAVLFFFLKRFLFKPLEVFLENRRESIRSQLEEAQKQSQKADDLYNEYKHKLDNSRDEIYHLLQSAKKEAEDLRKAKIDQASREAEGLIARAKEEIERQKKQVSTELLEKTVDLSLMAASKILEEHLSPKEHHVLINQAIEKMGEGKWIQ